MLSIVYCNQNQWSQNSIKNKPFITINLSVIVIKLQIIPVHIWPFRTLRRHVYALSVTDQSP